MVSVDDLNVLQLAPGEEIFFKQQLDALERKGVSTTALVAPGKQIDGAMVDRRGVREGIRYAPMVARELRRGDYDLIHANFGLTAPYAIAQFRLPVVLTTWGSDARGLYGLVTKACAWRCDAITVRSEEMRQLLGRDEAYVVPSGIDMDRFAPIDRAEARAHVGWEPEGTYVLFPYAPDYERKRYPLAKRVVERCRSRLGSDVELRTISGVPHEGVAYYMNASNAVLLTSEYEGSPNTVKEALACNVPVVSTPVGDVERRLEGVSPGGIGRNEDELVEQLVSVLESGRRSNGREAVEELAWDRIGDRFLEIYRDVLADGN